jgi:AcrR family transcriptional regulator
MEEPVRYMKMSELAKLSGVSVEKIRHYIQKEILPKPIKINRTAALYTRQHLERLELIKKLHKENELPITVIRQMINSVIKIEGSGSPVQAENPSVVREQLVNSSIELFRKKGYEGTTITDIVKAANIARNTFYRYFRSKEELFLECLNEIFFRWSREAPRDNKVLSAATYRNRLNRIFVAGHKAYPRWSDMMNLLRAAAVKNPKTFADKLQSALETRIKPIVDDINDCIKQGVLRKVNSELLAVILAGMFEYICYFMYRGKFTQEAFELSDQTVDILFNGVLAHRSEENP